MIEIRSATVKDISLCTALDHDYETDHVWQMQEYGGTLDKSISFRQIRLPRSMTVSYPARAEFLLEDWQGSGCFLVAAEGAQVLGYLDLQVQRWQRVCWIMNLVVDSPFRRHGIGNLMFERGLAWARSLELRSMMVELQTKNHPGISFAQRRGFALCGYNDDYYCSGDIALFWSLGLT